jgi:hypothetical protein
MGAWVMLHRRSFIAGLFCAPAIVQFKNIMPLKLVWPDEVELHVDAMLVNCHERYLFAFSDVRADFAPEAGVPRKIASCIANPHDLQPDALEAMRDWTDTLMTTYTRPEGSDYLEANVRGAIAREGQPVQIDYKLTMSKV